jgi:hypothetical protein
MVSLIDTVDDERIDYKVVISRNRFSEGILEAYRALLIHGNVDIEYVGFSAEELSELKLNFEKLEKWASIIREKVEP